MQPDVVQIGRRLYPLPDSLTAAAEVRIEALWRAAVAGNTASDQVAVEVIHHALGTRAAFAAAFRGRREVLRVTHLILTAFGHTSQPGALPWD